MSFFIFLIYGCLYLLPLLCSKNNRYIPINFPFIERTSHQIDFELYGFNTDIFLPDLTRENQEKRDRFFLNQGVRPL